MKLLKITTWLLVTLLVANTTLVFGQVKKRRKLNTTQISCANDRDRGTLCGPPIIVRSDIKESAAQNIVNVQILIDEKGNVISAKAVSGNPKLYEAALANARGQKFSPKHLSGKPVKVTGIIVYRFEEP